MSRRSGPTIVLRLRLCKDSQGCIHRGLWSWLVRSIALARSKSVVSPGEGSAGRRQVASVTKAMLSGQAALLICGRVSKFATIWALKSLVWKAYGHSILLADALMTPQQVDGMSRCIRARWGPLESCPCWLATISCKYQSRSWMSAIAKVHTTALETLMLTTWRRILRRKTLFCSRLPGHRPDRTSYRRLRRCI